MAERYFTELIQGDTARIEGPDAAHLARVMRARAGEVLCLCDGNNTDYEAEITSVSQKEILLRVLSSRPATGEPSLWAEAFIGYARGERMDWAVQKSVELGASVIHPFYCERCVVKPGPGDANKTLRLGRVAREAAKQCGRGILPRVEPPTGFPEMLQKAVLNDPALFLYEEGGASIASILGRPGRVSIITGPEGGFTPAEAALARESGCHTIGLGPRILRSETAPVAALAVVMALTGNLEG